MLAGLAVTCIAVLAVGCASTGTPFGLAGGPSPDVPALLERIPAQTALDTSALKRDLARLDADAIRSLCYMLVDPGTGDDTKPRMALHALAIHAATREGRAVRRRFIDVVGEALDSELTVSAKVFLIEQLEFPGTDRAAASLGRCLTADGLCAPAARTLLTIAAAHSARVQRVSTVFREALPKTTGLDRVTIVSALGVLGDRKSVPAFLQAAKSDDPMLRRAALDALARCGDPAARQVLVEATRATSLVERSQAIDRLLTFALSLDEHRKQADAVSIIRKLIAEHEDGHAVHVHCAALETLATVLGDRAIDDVIAALDSDSLELRAAAAKLAATIPGRAVTRSLIARLDTATPAGRAGMLGVLSVRGDQSALPAALAALKDEDPDVRLAAIDAASKLGQTRAVDALLTALDTDVEEQRQAARDALCGISGGQVTKTVAAAIRKAPTHMKIDLLMVLAGRAALGETGIVFAASRDADEAVRIAAAGALEMLAAPNSTPALIALLTEADAEDEREALVSAIAATVKRAADVPALVATVIAAADGQPTPTFCCLLRVLGRVGGDEALAEVRTALADDRAEAVEAAVRTLAEWPDASAADDLLAVARDSAELTHNVLALRGYARVLGLASDRDAATTVKMHVAGIDVARRPEETKLLLAGVGGVKDGAALAVLDPRLDDEALRGEAAVAMVGVAEAVVGKDWPRCEAAMARVLATEVPDDIRDRALAVLDKIATYDGHITDWLVSGPYTDGKKTGSQMFGVAFPPEDPKAGEVEWRPYPMDDSSGPVWRIDLGAVMEGADVVAYLRTRVFSPASQPAVLELGSDDGVAAWLNGTIVRENNATRGCAPAQERVEVTLNEGWNDLLLKVTNNGGTWHACARFRGSGGDRLDGVYAAAGDGTGDNPPASNDTRTE